MKLINHCRLTGYAGVFSSLFIMFMIPLTIFAGLQIDILRDDGTTWRMPFELFEYGGIILAIPLIFVHSKIYLLKRHIKGAFRIGIDNIDKIKEPYVAHQWDNSSCYIMIKPIDEQITFKLKYGELFWT